MRQALGEAFARYGRAAEIRRGEETQETRAFLQPMLREGEDEPLAATPLGAKEEQRWRYLGPAEAEVRMGDRVICGERMFVALRAQAFYAGEEILYHWAVLAPEETT